MEDKKQIDTSEYTTLTLDQLRRMQDGINKFRRDPQSESLKKYWARVYEERKPEPKTVKQVSEVLTDQVVRFEQEVGITYEIDRVRPQLIEAMHHLKNLVNGETTKGVFLHGKSGVGKSTMMQLYLRTYQAIKGGNYLATIRADQLIYKEAEMIGTAYNHCCIDDLGTEVNHARPISANGYVPQKQEIVQAVFYILDKRRHGGKITHATSNMDFSELVDLYGERSVWRLQELFHFIKF